MLIMIAIGIYALAFRRLQLFSSYRLEGRAAQFYGVFLIGLALPYAMATASLFPSFVTNFRLGQSWYQYETLLVLLTSILFSLFLAAPFTRMGSAPALSLHESGFAPTIRSQWIDAAFMAAFIFWVGIHIYDRFPEIFAVIGFKKTEGNSNYFQLIFPLHIALTFVNFFGAYRWLKVHFLALLDKKRSLSHQ